jgi:DNA-binding Lrp family transcriptional regulator
VIDDDRSRQLFDPLNQRIVRELVDRERSIGELSRVLHMTPIRVWRRVRKLVSAKILEQSRSVMVGNLEKKFYRASALRYIPQQFLEVRPKNEVLRGVFNTFLEIQMGIMKASGGSIDIPESVDPLDFGVYIDVSAFCKAFKDPATLALIRKLDDQLSHFKDFDRFLRPND